MLRQITIERRERELDEMHGALIGTFEQWLDTSMEYPFAEIAKDIFGFSKRKIRRWARQRLKGAWRFLALRKHHRLSPLGNQPLLKDEKGKPHDP